ncbi:hypothetical protein [Sphingobacterium mizutaii]|uniref:hypothetical protein n=1 Tax=Sphingobacterium mizutaii TaxID=1010 RepID=UPI0028A235A3|nr:hypothetical protein [Sphingobacterium mizutaii]
MKEQLRQRINIPLVFIVFVLSSILSIAIDRIFFKEDSRNDDCQEQVQYLRERVEKLEIQVDDFTKIILFKNAQIENRDLALDSLKREVVNEKECRNYFLYGIIVILLIMIFWFPNSGKTKVELPQEAKEAVNAEVTKITKKIDENGMEHAIISDKENVIQSFYELDDSTKIRLDSVTKLLGIERKQFKEWRHYNTSISAKDLPAFKTDTGFYYKDKYSHIEFIKGKESLSKEKFNFSYNAEINYQNITKRIGF